ncbi:MAG: hypothetical protein N4A49_05380 [Marinifilaceae bacterium]|jgi:hypothetical protein|nr:hypothetical protein [Marinifilaceae bacterium]
MKHIINFSIVTIFISFFFASCSKDKGNKNSVSYISINGEKHSLSSGFYTVSEKDDPRDITIRLCSTGFKLYEEDGNFDKLKGKGCIVIFGIYSQEKNNISLGNYIHHSNYGDNLNEDYYYYAETGIGVSSESKVGSFYSLEGDDLYINRNGNEYEISLTDTKNDIKIYYKGSLDRYTD